MPASSLRCRRTLPFPNLVSTREDHLPLPRLSDRSQALPAPLPKELHPGRDRPVAHWVEAPDTRALWPVTTIVEHVYSVLGQDFVPPVCTANCHVYWLPSLAALSNTAQHTSSAILQTLPATPAVKTSIKKRRIKLGKKILQSCG